MHFVQIFCRTITRAFGLDSSNDTNQLYWLGLRDPTSEDRFHWVNENYANRYDDSLWYPGRPRIGDDDFDCCAAYFSTPSQYAFLAQDALCLNVYHSICEKLV